MGDVVEGHFLGDGGDAHEAGFAPVAVDVVFGGVAHAAEGLHGAIGAEERGFGGEVFGGVGEFAAFEAGVVAASGFAGHHQRGFEAHARSARGCEIAW